jgi:hypothetical protein
MRMYYTLLIYSSVYHERNSLSLFLLLVVLLGVYIERYTWLGVCLASPL